MKSIKQARFKALAGYFKYPEFKVKKSEIEWYASHDEHLLATILGSDTGKNFAFVIVGWDADHRYRYIYSESVSSIEDARQGLQSEMEALEQKGLPFTKQKGEGKKRDVFEPVCDTTQFHPCFEKMHSQKPYQCAKEIIAEMMYQRSDVNEPFMDRFPKADFDARLWELYLLGYFNEEKLDINQEDYEPGFLVSGADQVIAINTITIPEPHKDDVEGINTEPVSPEKVKVFLENYMPVRFGAALDSKLGKKRWKLWRARNRPLVLAVADFHNAQSMLWCHSALSNYLYGTANEYHVTEDNKIVNIPRKIEFHEHGGKKIPSGFFFTENAENISAVMFSTTCTMAKFSRMGKVAGFGEPSTNMLYWGLCHKHDSEVPGMKRFIFKVDENYDEKWGQGMTVFHNPNARFPLSSEVFPSAAHYTLEENGAIKSKLPEFYPYRSATIVGV